MEIRVLLFAQLREKFGTSERILKVRDGMTVTALGQQLLEEAGLGDMHAEALQYAVNEQLVTHDQVLRDGDVFAVLTPVAGG